MPDPMDDTRSDTFSSTGRALNGSKVQGMCDDSSSAERTANGESNRTLDKWTAMSNPTEGFIQPDQEDGENESVTWRTFFFDDSMRKQGAPPCRMIHPRSYFAQAVLAISTCALAYTAAVVPVVISFEWNKANQCEWGDLLSIDLFVDSFFIFDVLLSFFLAECDRKVIPLSFSGQVITSTDRHAVVGAQKGNVNDNWREVLWKYVTGVFWFDLVTALPISFAELFVYYECQRSSGIDGELDPSKWRFARLIKPLKFVRIMRVYRAFATIDIAYRLERLLHVQPIAFSLFRVVLGIFATTHCAACSFWMVKVLSTSPEEVAEFLEGHGLAPDAPTSQQYVLCCYFIVTIFTTVGFGDISATNTYEQVACMLLMMTGAMVFGTLLAEVQSGVSELRKLVREKGHAIQELKNFMRTQTVPAETEKRILDWADFEVTVGQQRRMLEVAMERLTVDQRLEMVVHMFSQDSANIDLLNLEHPAAPEMHAHLWAAAETVVFEEGKVMVQPGELLRAMFVIAVGVVRVEDLDGNKVVELSKGDALGAWALMGDGDASSPFGFPVVFVAATHLQLYKVSRDTFEEVLAMCPAGLAAELRDKWAKHQRSKEHVEMLATHTCSFRRAAARWGAMADKAVKRELRKRSTTTKRQNSANHVRAARLKNPAFGPSKAFASADHPPKGNGEVSMADGLAGMIHRFASADPSRSPVPSIVVAHAPGPSASPSPEPRASVASARRMEGVLVADVGVGWSGGGWGGGLWNAGAGADNYEQLSSREALVPASAWPDNAATAQSGAEASVRAEASEPMDALVFFGFAPPQQPAPAPSAPEALRERVQLGPPVIHFQADALGAAPLPPVLHPRQPSAHLAAPAALHPPSQSLPGQRPKPPPLHASSVSPDGLLDDQERACSKGGGALPGADGMRSPQQAPQKEATTPRGTEQGGMMGKNVARLESRVTAIDGNVEQLQEELAELKGMVAAVLKCVGGGRHGEEQRGSLLLGSAGRSMAASAFTTLRPASAYASLGCHSQPGAARQLGSLPRMGNLGSVRRGRVEGEKREAGSVLAKVVHRLRLHRDHPQPPTSPTNQRDRSTPRSRGRSEAVEMGSRDGSRDSSPRALSPDPPLHPPHRPRAPAPLPANPAASSDEEGGGSAVAPPSHLLPAAARVSASVSHAAAAARPSLPSFQFSRRHRPA